MIYLKDDSIGSSFSPGMLLGVIVVAEAYATIGKDAIITSGRDGVHSETSLHYNGDAADFRTRNLTNAEKKFVVDELKQRLNRHYDVILESDHLHVEYQPRAS